MVRRVLIVPIVLQRIPSEFAGVIQALRVGVIRSGVSSDRHILRRPSQKLPLRGRGVSGGRCRTGARTPDMVGEKADASRAGTLASISTTAEVTAAPTVRVEGRAGVPGSSLDHPGHPGPSQSDHLGPPLHLVV